MARKRSKKTRTQKRTRRRTGYAAYIKDFFATLRFLWKTVTFALASLLATLRWWWGLPRWLKWGKLAVIALVVVTLPALDAMRQWLHYREIYTTYYNHFYTEYTKTLSHRESHHYARYYADFYAEYYSSPAFRQSLQNALPSATAETVSFPPSSPTARQQTNAAGLALIKQYEGLVLEPYADAGGKLTVGYGHLVKPGEFFSRLSEQQAHNLLREDVRVAEAYVKRYVKVKLNDNQFSALVSLVYNVGPGNFQRSTLLRLLNQGNGDKAAKEFLRWNKVGTRVLSGLQKRREAEKRLFES